MQEEEEDKKAIKPKRKMNLKKKMNQKRKRKQIWAMKQKTPHYWPLVCLD
jgi:hypothetical protein